MEVITITFNNDATAIITDTMYPYNVKLLIDENSDFCSKINRNKRL